MSFSSKYSFKFPPPKNEFEAKKQLQYMSNKILFDTTRFFLECYRTSKITSIFSKKFLEECPLYSEESIIPETYETLEKPYNRNLAFYYRHGPYSGYNKGKDFYQNVPPNYYPKEKGKLSPFCELEIKNNNYFTKNFEVKKVEEESKNGELILNEKAPMLKELKLEDIFGIDFEKLEREHNLMKHNQYDVNVRIPGKLWQFKVCNEKNVATYGPYISDFVYNFLKNYYLPLMKKGIDIFNGATLLITDMSSDVHYLPDILLNLLDDQKEKSEDNENEKKEDNKGVNEIITNSNV